MAEMKTDHSSDREFISIGEPDITELEIQSVSAQLASGWLTRGKACQAFEQEFAEYTGAHYALAVNSCTAALHLALLVNQIGPGDEVILPALTFAATGHVVAQSGAQPVFGEIDPVRLCLDPQHVASLISPRTKALMPVHMAGHPAPRAELLELCQKHGMVMIEDAAHALAAEDHGQQIGAWPSTAAFSFFPNKNMTTGDGGMLVLPSEEQRSQAERLAQHGMDRDAWKRFRSDQGWRYEVTEFGYKYNAHDLMAALGRAQLSRLEEMQTRRRQVASWYREGLDGLEQISLPCQQGETHHAWHLFVIQLTTPKPGQRDQLITQLRQQGIGATLHYDPLHLHSAYRQRFGFQPGMLPTTEAVCSRCLSLPIHSRLPESQVDYVCATVKTLLTS